MPDLPLGVQPEPLIPEPAPPEPEAPAPPAPRDPQRRLLEDLKKTQTRYRALEVAAAAAGVDVSDVPGYMARREADARARADREARVRDEVKTLLIEGGHKLDRKLVNAIIQGAIGDSSVAVDEKGDLCGVSEYADGWLASLSSGEPKPRPVTPPVVKPSPVPPSRGRAGSEGAPSSTMDPTTFVDLVKQGPAAVTAFFSRFPAKYAALKAAHDQGLRGPTR